MLIRTRASAVQAVVMAVSPGVLMSALHVSVARMVNGKDD